MTDGTGQDLRFGWTTGACATASVAAACAVLTGRACPDSVTITLPRGQTPCFPVAHFESGPGWCQVGIVKDAGDDPDVTHGVTVIARVTVGASGSGIVFHAGEGVGTVTRPGLPIPPGEAAINPVPRQMMGREIHAAGLQDVLIEISIPGGAEIALKTWNPRLGISGGLSILGTTGIVRPFSCAAWIASIHRGIDVARADGLTHVAGTTGATSERSVQTHLSLPDHAMLDMGDFYGGMLKYLLRHPVARLTIGGGIGKMAKLAQGATDLHSGRSQVDFSALADLGAKAGLDAGRIADSRTALEALTATGPELAQAVASAARARVQDRIADAPITADIVIVDRAGAILALAR